MNKIKIVILLLLNLMAFAVQTGRIEGLVKDQAGNPLVGANIFLNGTSYGNISDKNGAYFIIAPIGVYQLNCQYVGYKLDHQIVKIIAEKSINVNFVIEQDIYILKDIVRVEGDPPKIEKSVQIGVRSPLSTKLPIYYPSQTDDNLKRVILAQGLTTSDANNNFHNKGGFNHHLNVDYLINDMRFSQTDNPFTPFRLFDNTLYNQTTLLGNNEDYPGFISMLPGYSESDKIGIAYTADNINPELNSYQDCEITVAENDLQICADKNQRLYYTLSGRLNQQSVNDNNFDYPAYDLTGSSIDFKQKQFNTANLSISSLLTTDKNQIKLLVSTDRKHNLGVDFELPNCIDHRFKLQPDKSPEFIIETDQLAFGLKHVINRDSYFSVLAGYQFNKTDYLPEMNKLPSDFSIKPFSYFDYDQDGFIQYNEHDELADFSRQRATTAIFKAQYFNQLNRYNLSKMTFGLIARELDYYHLQGSGISYNSPFAEIASFNDLYPDRGYNKLGYKIKPLEYSLNFGDKFDNEDLIVELNLNFDGRYWEDDINGSKRNFDYYDFNPQIKITNAVTERSKLCSQFGIRHYKPDYTSFYKSLSYSNNSELESESEFSTDIVYLVELNQYLISCNLFYRDVKKVILEKIINTNTYSYSEMSNSGYMNSKGFSFDLKKLSTNNYSWMFNYKLSFADGTSPAETSNNYFFNSDYLYQKAALDWDVRHCFNINFAFMTNDEEFFKNIPFSNSISLMLYNSFSSGKPFTPTVEYYNYSKTQDQIKRNSERMPWSYNTDICLSKSLVFLKNLKGFNVLEFKLEILNLFNNTNLSKVYPATGEWSNPGKMLFDKTNDLNFYKNISNVSPKRNFRFGIRYDYYLEYKDFRGMQVYR